MVIFDLLFIYVAVAKKLCLLICFAGYLPVFSCVLAFNSLIINTIYFSGTLAIAGCFLLCGAAHTGECVGCGNECCDALGNYILT